MRRGTVNISVKGCQRWIRQEAKRKTNEEIHGHGKRGYGGSWWDRKKNAEARETWKTMIPVHIYTLKLLANHHKTPEEYLIIEYIILLGVTFQIQVFLLYAIYDLSFYCYQLK